MRYQKVIIICMAAIFVCTKSMDSHNLLEQTKVALNQEVLISFGNVRIPGNVVSISSRMMHNKEIKKYCISWKNKLGRTVNACIKPSCILYRPQQLRVYDFVHICCGSFYVPAVVSKIQTKLVENKEVEQYWLRWRNSHGNFVDALINSKYIYKKLKND